MGEHLVRFPTGSNVTFTATTVLTGGQLVEVTGNREVGVAGAGSAKVVGSASQDAAVGDQITVNISGQVDVLVAAQAVSAGDLLDAAAVGQVQPHTTGSVVGVALSPAVIGATAQVLTV